MDQSKTIPPRNGPSVIPRLLDAVNKAMNVPLKCGAWSRAKLLAAVNANPIWRKTDDAKLVSYTSRRGVRILTREVPSGFKQSTPQRALVLVLARRLLSASFNLGEQGVQLLRELIDALFMGLQRCDEEGEGVELCQVLRPWFTWDWFPAVG